MRIENVKEFDERLDQAIAAVSEDERYATTLKALRLAREGTRFFDFEGGKAHFARRLLRADAKYPMHPLVAKIMIDVFEDGIENHKKYGWSGLGFLYYTGRAGEQNSEKAAYYFDMAESFGDKYDDLSESIMAMLVSE